MADRKDNPKSSQHKPFVMDPVYKSSLVMRSNDVMTPKTRYYDLDLESQREKEKTLLENAAGNGSRRRSRGCSLCCCSCFYLTLILLIALGIVVLILVPKDPAVSLGDLRLTEFAYNDSSSTTQILAEFAVDLNVRNRNAHADTIYSEINVNLFFRSQALGTIPPQRLEQKRKMTSAVVLQLPRTQTVIQSKADADVLKEEVAASNVQVELRGLVKGKHKVLGLRVKSFDIAVRCVYNLQPDGGPQGTQPKQISHSCYYDA